MAQWRLESGTRRLFPPEGWRRDRGRNARGQGLGSTPSLTWSAHESG